MCFNLKKKLFALIILIIFLQGVFSYNIREGAIGECNEQVKLVFHCDYLQSTYEDGDTIPTPTNYCNTRIAPWPNQSTAEIILTKVDENNWVSDSTISTYNRSGELFLNTFELKKSTFYDSIKCLHLAKWELSRIVDKVGADRSFWPSTIKFSFTNFANPCPNVRFTDTFWGTDVNLLHTYHTNSSNPDITFWVNSNGDFCTKYSWSNYSSCDYASGQAYIEVVSKSPNVVGCSHSPIRSLTSSTPRDYFCFSSKTCQTNWQFNNLVENSIPTFLLKNGCFEGEITCDSLPNLPEDPINPKNCTIEQEECGDGSCCNVGGCDYKRSCSNQECVQDLMTSCNPLLECDLSSNDCLIQDPTNPGEPEPSPEDPNPIIDPDPILPTVPVVPITSNLNKILVLEAERDLNISTRIRCDFATDANILIKWEGGSAEINNYDCNTQLVQTLHSIQNLPTEGRLEIVATIPQPCDVCQKTVYLLISEPVQTIIPDNNFISGIFMFVLVFALIILRNKKSN